MSDDTVEPAKRGRGRPAGSRNKSTLMKAQVMIDDLTIDCVLHAEALMKNDTDYLNSSDDVPYTVRFNAMKELLSKGIANEKEKDAPKPQSTQGTSTDADGTKTHLGPKVYSTAAPAKSTA